mmetsp:Transcript_17212/g.27496  ORF Transcript_17212/g.27496 Transcript_17212/m.27496 type:complete len:144 (-) Transcript_17212:107-538(-)
MQVSPDGKKKQREDRRPTWVIQSQGGRPSSGRAGLRKAGESSVSPKKNNGSDESKKLGKELMEMLKQLKLEVYETEFEAQKLTKIGQLLKLYEWAPFGAIGEALGMKIGETIELYTEIQSRRHKMGLPDHNHKNDHLACCNIS